MAEQMIEEVTVGNQALRLVHDDIPLDKLELDENNPRIRYRLIARLDFRVRKE